MSQGVARSKIAELIHKNCADECNAQAGYQELIAELFNLDIERRSSDGKVYGIEGITREMVEKAIQVIRNIQKDEMEHTMLLVQLANEWDGVITNSDEMKKALNDLAKKVGQ